VDEVGGGGEKREGLLLVDAYRSNKGGQPFNS
jgi:hypothetical protein